MSRVILASRAAQRLVSGIDRFVLALALTILAATILPCHGPSATIFHALGLFAISSLFFLQGARLSRLAVVNGITHWRLHALIALTTFGLFPLMALALWLSQPSLLPDTFWIGVLFACALPSTVQSSIALTSIAGGNVAGAVCSATLSNIAGIALTPLLFGVISRAHSSGTVDPSSVLWVVLQLLVPFAAGHTMRPWIGAWAERNRPVLALTDRGSILLVAYTAFSAAVVHGIWQMAPAATFATLLLIAGTLLVGSLAAITLAGRLCGFNHEDTVAALFCGSQKSLVSGVPIANVLFPPAMVGSALLAIMVYYPLQLIVCGVLSRRFARASAMQRLPVVAYPLAGPGAAVSPE